MVLNPHANLEAGGRCPELAGLLAQFIQSPGLYESDWAGLTFIRREAPTEPNPCFYQPVLAIVAQGAKEVRVGTFSHTYDQAHYLLASVDIPVFSRVIKASRESPYLSLALALKLPLVAELMAELGDGPTQGAASCCGLSVSPVSESLLEAVLRLVRLLQTPEDLPVLAPMLEREILYRLLTGPQGPRLRHLATRDSQSYQIARAIAWLKQHFASPLRLQELAQETNMSISSLHHHFKAITAISPLQFQKQLRLQEARRLMLMGADAANASHQVGYESPSQFSREYSRSYGAPPRRDVARLRPSGSDQAGT